MEEFKPTVREGTWDVDPWVAVYKQNEYKVDDDLSDYAVIDIGAHTGAFSRLCLDRGCVGVFAFEPVPDNAILFAENLKDYAGKIHAKCAAVWRSDGIGCDVGLHLDSRGWHSGGANIMPPGMSSNFELQNVSPENTKINTIPFDDIVIMARDRFPNHKLLVKMDCEGSEFPILLTSKTIHMVDVFVGEYHLVYPQIADLPPFTVKSLVDAFRSFGRDVWFFGDEKFGHFGTE